MYLYGIVGLDVRKNANALINEKAKSGLADYSLQALSNSTTSTRSST